MKVYKLVQSPIPYDSCFCEKLAELGLPVFLCNDIVYSVESEGRGIRQLIVKVLDENG